MADGGARFSIEGEYVYRIGSGQPAYQVRGEYWYDFPLAIAPRLWERGRLIYALPDKETPKYFLLTARGPVG
jgi:hypothetical protein